MEKKIKKKESQVQQHDRIPAVLLEPLLIPALQCFVGRFPVIHSFIWSYSDRCVVTGIVVPLNPPEVFDPALVIVMIIHHSEQSI